MPIRSNVNMIENQKVMFVVKRNETVFVSFRELLSAY